MRIIIIADDQNVSHHGLSCRIYAFNRLPHRLRYDFNRRESARDSNFGHNSAACLPPTVYIGADTTYWLVQSNRLAHGCLLAGSGGAGDRATD